jgi:hypothetical protein
MHQNPTQPESLFKKSNIGISQSVSRSVGLKMHQNPTQPKFLLKKSNIGISQSVSRSVGQSVCQSVG